MLSVLELNCYTVYTAVFKMSAGVSKGKFGDCEVDWKYGGICKARFYF
jgi:hypothetical protein